MYVGTNGLPVIPDHCSMPSGRTARLMPSSRGVLGAADTQALWGAGVPALNLAFQVWNSKSQLYSESEPMSGGHRWCRERYPRERCCGERSHTIDALGCSAGRTGAGSCWVINKVDACICAHKEQHLACNWCVACNKNPHLFSDAKVIVSQSLKSVLLTRVIRILLQRNRRSSSLEPSTVTWWYYPFGTRGTFFVRPPSGRPRV